MEKIETKETVAFQVLKRSIEQGSLETIKKILNAMPWDTLEEKYITSIFAFALSVCAQVQNASTLRMLLSYWDEQLRYTYGFLEQEDLPNKAGFRSAANYDEEDVLPAYAYIFSLAEIPTQVLALTTRAYPEVSSTELLSMYSRFEGRPEVSFAMKRIVQIYPPENFTVYSKLLQDAKDNGNQNSQLFLGTLVEKYAPYAEKPAWMRDFTDMQLGRLPVLSDYQEQLEEFKKMSSIENIDVEEVVEALTSGLKQLGIDIGEIEQSKILLREKYIKANTREKEEMLRPLLEKDQQEEMRESEDLFHLFGPAFPVVSMNFALDTPCTKWGGCRLFLCTCAEKFDNDDDAGEDVVYEDAEWFTGVCDYCHKKIGNKRWAVRRPRSDGGWVGTYCSWNCVRGHIGFDIEMKKRMQKETGEEEEENVDMEEGDAEPLETCEPVVPNHEDFTLVVDSEIESAPFETKATKEEKSKTEEKEENKTDQLGKSTITKLLQDPTHNVDVLSLLLCDYFEEQMLEKGIQDMLTEKQYQIFVETEETEEQIREDVYRTETSMDMEEENEED